MSKLYLIILFIIIFVFSVQQCRASSLHSKIEKGNELCKQEKYDEALNSYVDAQIEHPENPHLKYNIASTHYKMNNFEEAVKGFLDVAATAQNAQLEEKALYNTGNAMYRQGKLEEAVEYYKKALALDPDDLDAQKNLEFVREEIKKRINESKDTQKKQQEQQQQQQNDKQNQTCQNPQQQQQPGQDNQDGQQANDNQTRQAGQQQDNQTHTAQQDEKTHESRGKNQTASERASQDDKIDASDAGQAQAREMTREEAAQWLNGLQENRDTIKEGQKKQARPGAYGSGKDW